MFREKYQRGETSWNITGSVGAALYPEDASDYQMLLEKADTALYVSKNKKEEIDIHYIVIVMKNNNI